MYTTKTTKVATVLLGLGIAACSSNSSSAFGDGGAASTLTQPGETPLRHYASTAACRTQRPAVTPIPAGGDGGAEQTCTGCCGSDADCVAGTNGRCLSTGLGALTCSYDECASSNDCAPGKTCACGDFAEISANVCATSNCRTDADCGAGGYCSPSVALGCRGPGPNYDGAYCHTANDQCVNDADCSGQPQNGHGPEVCVYDKEVSHWKCATPGCAG